MKIAMYLSLAAETGGIFQYARTVLHALSRSTDADVQVVALSPKGTKWQAIAEAFGVEWHEVPDLTPVQRVAGKAIRTVGGFSPAARRAMSKVTPLGIALDDLGADLCIYTDSEHFAYELATPSLIPVHDLMHRYESHFAENRAFASPDELLQHICDGAAGILVDSEVGKEQLVESYGPVQAKIFVLPYIPPDYIYDESLLPPDPELPAMLERLPMRFFFYPAQFWEHKNHIRLIEALVRASERYPDMHLVLAGSKKVNYDAVVARIHELGAENRVTMLGFVSDRAKSELYRRATALVMPTFYGPTNIPPLEAFELGCPVAASNVYGMPAQLGDAALLFDPNSVEEIQDALERLWSDEALREMLIERGHERAKAWGPAEFSATLWAAIRELVGARA